jgi:hypothetical protein
MANSGVVATEKWITMVHAGDVESSILFGSSPIVGTTF